MDYLVPPDVELFDYSMLIQDPQEAHAQWLGPVPVNIQRLRPWGLLEAVQVQTDTDYLYSVFQLWWATQEELNRHIEEMSRSDEIERDPVRWEFYMLLRWVVAAYFYFPDNVTAFLEDNGVDRRIRRFAQMLDFSVLYDRPKRRRRFATFQDRFNYLRDQP